MKIDPNITPPCVGKHELFDSRNIHDHIEAKQICRGCPVILQCAVILRDVRAASTGGVNGGPEGTWAGSLVGEPRGRGGRKMLKQAS